MNNLIINETPVRTSKNFKINNIKLNDINLPKEIDTFTSYEIKNNNCNVEIIEGISKNNKIELKYGLSEDLTNYVNEKCNKELKVVINNKEKVNRENTAIQFEFNDNNLNLVEKINIVAEEQSEGTILIKYMSEKDIKAFHNGIIKIQAQSDSNLKVIIVNYMNEVSNNFLSIENIIEDNAKVEYCIIDFGGKNSITNYYSNLIGKESINRINTIYLGRGEQLLDLNYITELLGEKSNVNIDVQGALKDSAKKHFKGTIDFKKGCKKSKGNENENCMLLSKTAKSIALPMLLCSEEDVEGNHSSSSGKIGKKELFYIMSRGFSLKEAQKLLVRAKFNNILENIENEELKNEIIQEIDKRLD